MPTTRLNPPNLRGRTETRAAPSWDCGEAPSKDQEGGVCADCWAHSQRAGSAAAPAVRPAGASRQRWPARDNGTAAASLPADGPLLTSVPLRRESEQFTVSYVNNGAERHPMLLRNGQVNVTTGIPCLWVRSLVYFNSCIEPRGTVTSVVSVPSTQRKYPKTPFRIYKLVTSSSCSETNLKARPR